MFVVTLGAILCQPCLNPNTEIGCVGAQARVYVAVLLMFVVTLGLLYVVLFVSGDSQPSVWAVMLLRILAFLLPVYLIVQACAATAVQVHVCKTACECGLLEHKLPCKSALTAKCRLSDSDITRTLLLCESWGSV